MLRIQERLSGMSILTFFHWLAHTTLGVAMRDSTWGFAIVEIVHLLALAIFGGAVLLVDLRLLGRGFKTQPTAQVARELLPITAGGVVVMLISGVLLVASGPMRYYYNPAFRIKMWLFLVALFVHFLLQTVTARRDVQDAIWQKAGAVASLLLWLSIGLVGRAIGFV
jgi:uncharacterized membrane protein